MYPVDLLAVDDTDLTSASERYLSSLESSPHNNEVFQPSQMSKVEITPNNVRRLQLFEDDQPDCTLLVLHPPDDPTQGPVVQERVIVFLLSQVVERSDGGGGGGGGGGPVLPTPPHRELQAAVERQSGGRLLHRQTQRQPVRQLDGSGLPAAGSGHGAGEEELQEARLRPSDAGGFLLLVLQREVSGSQLSVITEHGSRSATMLLRIVDSCSPLLCRRFLQRHEDERERLYEVEAPGSWTQRRNIWLNIQLGRYSLGVKETSRPTPEETQRKEGDGDSAQKKQPHNCRLDLTSSSTCDVDTAPAIGFPGQQVKAFDPSQAAAGGGGGGGGGSSQSGEIPGTGCSPTANANASDLDSGPPVGPTRSQNTKQALISKPCVSAERHREEPEDESQRRAKRVRRT
ncbi:hypothetical protein D9C73_007014 [Collichthys lucidus]|uniref:Uncharacterized protein n=1 Tax=Collichthys lucidus TaxID=240159 RepID=A0A4U5UED9_COLLU|nr:hypothetical protein D9C73_007014 [Collichthys lucidus]